MSTKKKVQTGNEKFVLKFGFEFELKMQQRLGQ